MGRLKGDFVYQIYPASFKDSNRDGFGDLNGIREKLGYLTSIGVRHVWLSPIFLSPMVDMGYDIADYKAIDPRFGTMADFLALVQAAKANRIGILLDLVVNHTSDQHPWFTKALSDPSSPYRDFYFFRKGKGNHRPPNNWTSMDFKSAWTELPNEPDVFYLHTFSKTQPDLNWSNPKVVEAIQGIMRFWLDKGIEGFRIDLVTCYAKTGFQDGRKTTVGTGQEHYVAQPENHSLVKKLTEVADGYDALLIGECFGASRSDIARYEIDHELDMGFSFDLTHLPTHWRNGTVKSRWLKRAIIALQTQIPWNANYFENHDLRRSPNRFVARGFRQAGTKALLGILMTLKGTPFVYQGEELGAVDYVRHDPSKALDLVTQAILEFAKEKHLPKFLGKTLASRHSRDNARAPMAFDYQPGFGFSGINIKPWIRYNERSGIINVQKESENPESALSFFKALVKIRNDNPVLAQGRIHFLPSKSRVLAYLRLPETGKKDDAIRVVVNLSRFSLGINPKLSKGELLLANRHEIKPGRLTPYEIRIYRIPGQA